MLLIPRAVKEVKLWSLCLILQSFPHSVRHQNLQHSVTLIEFRGVTCNHLLHACLVLGAWCQHPYALLCALYRLHYEEYASLYASTYLARHHVYMLLISNFTKACNYRIFSAYFTLYLLSLYHFFSSKTLPKQ